MIWAIIYRLADRYANWQAHRTVRRTYPDLYQAWAERDTGKKP